MYIQVVGGFLPSLATAQYRWNRVEGLGHRLRSGGRPSEGLLEAGTVRIFVLDNYDSFTYNLVQRLGELDPSLEIVVERNDQITVEQIAGLNPDRIIISPGPCTPSEAGISVECVRFFAGKVPLLGVCLGHQSIGQAFGANIVRAKRLMHGKTDSIYHDRRGLFADLENPFVATRYHSLVIEPSSLPECFEICAWSFLPNGEREIMGIRHKEFPLYGVQFHPESFLTECGPRILKHFLDLEVARREAVR